MSKPTKSFVVSSTYSKGGQVASVPTVILRAGLGVGVGGTGVGFGVAVGGTAVGFGVGVGVAAGRQAASTRLTTNRTATSFLKVPFTFSS